MMSSILHPNSAPMSYSNKNRDSDDGFLARLLHIGMEVNMTNRFSIRITVCMALAAAVIALFPSGLPAGVPHRQLQAAQNPNPQVSPVGSSAHGKTYAEWSVLWWQWFLPLTAEQYAACSVGQSGHVAFLLAGPAACNVTVAPGTSLFFPIANVECSDLEAAPFHGDTADQRSACAAYWAGFVGNLAVEIDGVSLQDLAKYHVLSPDFGFTVGPDNVFAIPCSGQCSGSSSGDGYYLMLAPLSPGSHIIHISASGFGIDTTYTLNVGQ
jgi:hypothetical protein